MVDWEEQGFPSDEKIVQDIMTTAMCVWGVPDKDALFKRADEVAERDEAGSDAY